MSRSHTSMYTRHIHRTNGRQIVPAGIQKSKLNICCYFSPIARQATAHANRHRAAQHSTDG